MLVAPTGVMPVTIGANRCRAEGDVAPYPCPMTQLRGPARRPVHIIPARKATVGAIEVRRLLPFGRRRAVGAWCFVDHYGPHSVDGGPGMQVPPHPHLGLQTVTWLFSGNVVHRDSLGSDQLIEPRQLNVMTAGAGIAHAEQSPAEHDPWLHGVQLWVALPDRVRHQPPAFEHHADLPVVGAGPFLVTVFVGTLGDAISPATVHTPLIGAQVDAPRGGRHPIVVDPAHEHAVVVTAGRGALEGEPLAPGSIAVVDPGRDHLVLDLDVGSHALLLGGAPLDEELLLWWNFVARTPDELIAAVAAWREGRRFGQVTGAEAVLAPTFDPSLLLPPGAPR